MRIDFRIMNILGMVDEYHNYWFHIKGSLIGELLALVICNSWISYTIYFII